MPRPVRRTLAGLALLLTVTACSAGTGGGAAAPAEPTADASTPDGTGTPDSTPTRTREPERTPSPVETAAEPTLRQKEEPTISAEEQAELNRRLIAAAWDNDVARARRLIEAGADVNAKDETEQSAYLIATSEGYLDLLELTLRHGADVHSLDSFDGTGLIRAAERGHADIVGRLLQTPIRVNHVNNLGWTALHEAIILGDGSQRYVDTVRLLVAGGADVTIESRRDGLTPLQHAERKGFETIAATLRATLAHRDDPGRNADRRLLDAAERGRPDGAALALRDGAGLEARDTDGRTPLQLANRGDHADVARLLSALGHRAG